jgi:D-glycerate 3-kinase
MDTLDALIQSHALPAAYRAAVDSIHRPAADRIARRRRELGRTIVAGLCGSQGSGKSTMAAFLKVLLEAQGLKVAVLSLDDLYLTLPERERLSTEVHPLLRTRGVPGTHDTALGLRLFDALGGKPAAVPLPRFDKSEDTRAGEAGWPCVMAPVDVILFEGWCVGAVAQSDAALAEPVNALERDEDAGGAWRRHVNERLKTDYAALFGRIDILAMLQAPGFDVVYGWRSLQEKKLADAVTRQGTAGRKVMGPAEIARFLMFYQRLTEHVLREMPARADIVMPLDGNHRILGVEIRES